MIAQIVLVMGLFMLIMVSGCLTAGQAVDKGINETMNITGNVIEYIGTWFST